jgi:hypothetical protein
VTLQQQWALSQRLTTVVECYRSSCLVGLGRAWQRLPGELSCTAGRSRLCACAGWASLLLSHWQCRVISRSIAEYLVQAWDVRNSCKRNGSVLPLPSAPEGRGADGVDAMA